MKSKTTDYTTVTKANRGKITARLKSHGGSILIVEAGHRSFAPDHVIDATLYLFQQCKFVDTGVQAGWAKDYEAGRDKPREIKQLQDRKYWLRKKDARSGDLRWDHLVETRERLILTKNYGLEISPQCIVYRGYLDQGSTTLYIPDKRGFRSAFTFAITSMVNLINKQAKERKEPAPLTDEHIPKIIDYVLDDLVTGTAMRKNLEHGRMADAVLGMA